MSEAEMMRSLVEDLRGGAVPPGPGPSTDQNGEPPTSASPVHAEGPDTNDARGWQRDEALTSQRVERRAHSYEVVDGCIAHRGQPLCNFSAHIAEEIIRDDGAEEEKFL